MNRRTFITQSALATAAAGASTINAASGPSPSARSTNRSATKIAAYYLRAHMYTCVPHQIREDMAWMADKGTNYVCVAVLEQDLFAARENHALIVQEAARAGMQVLAVPSRWGGLTAGAPKVPSLFSVLHPHTWMVNQRGSTSVMPQVSGVISSVHWPETRQFFCDTLAELYRQHPAMAGFIIDEPKCFLVDKSAKATAALGADAPPAAHFGAARDFFSGVCRFAKERWPDRLTLLFQQAHKGAGELAAGAGVQPLDYYGCDGRPWRLEDDAKMKDTGEAQESGKGKVLLSGKGESFIRAARAVPGRRSFFLAENHNLTRSMIAPIERNLPAVLALGVDLFAYYYYPRNVEEPERVMEIIGRQLKAFTQPR